VILAPVSTVKQVCMCWRSLPWKGSSSHPCEYSIRVFTHAFSVLFNPASYSAHSWHTWWIPA